MKSRKAPGPDKITTDILKLLDAKHLEPVVDELNTWLSSGIVPEDQLLAQVVLIFKKGDSNRFENYRPISLLNSMYKLYASVLKQRLQTTLETYLDFGQFGFRPRRGTADALFLARRVADVGENSQLPVHMLLLDWEKAFDK
eukprot:116798-Prorocentrum_lima.AAC.1